MGTNPSGVVFRGRARHRTITGFAQSGSRGSDEPAWKHGRQLALALHRRNVVRAGFRPPARVDYDVGPRLMHKEKKNDDLANGAVSLAPSTLAADFIQPGDH